MSTRATIHFHYQTRSDRPEAIIYRHGDGYPDGLGRDLQAFVKELKENVRDNRFSDPNYLAAKWIVYDARKNIEMMSEITKKPVHYLGFLSVGVLSEDPGDIEYTYHVICDGKPTIMCESEGKRIRIL